MPVSVGLGLGAALLIEAGTSLQRLLSRGLLPARDGDADRHGDGVGDSCFHPNVGLVNLLLSTRRHRRQALAEHPVERAVSRSARIGIWQSLGFTTVLFLAGLKSVPRDLYDAAAVDGAHGAWSASGA